VAGMVVSVPSLRHSVPMAQELSVPVAGVSVHWEYTGMRQMPSKSQVQLIEALAQTFWLHGWLAPQPPRRSPLWQRQLIVGMAVQLDSGMGATTGRHLLLVAQYAWLPCIGSWAQLVLSLTTQVEVDWSHVQEIVPDGAHKPRLQVSVVQSPRRSPCMMQVLERAMHVVLVEQGVGVIPTQGPDKTACMVQYIHGAMHGDDLGGDMEADRLGGMK